MVKNKKHPDWHINLIRNIGSMGGIMFILDIIPTNNTFMVYINLTAMIVSIPMIIHLMVDSFTIVISTIIEDKQHG